MAKQRASASRKGELPVSWWQVVAEVVCSHGDKRVTTVCRQKAFSESALAWALVTTNTFWINPGKSLPCCLFKKKKNFVNNVEPTQPSNPNSGAAVPRPQLPTCYLLWSCVRQSDVVVVVGASAAPTDNTNLSVCWESLYFALFCT